jgi:hypothetical protein
MHIGNYINMVHKSQQDLAEAFMKIADHHGHEPDIKENCQLLAGWSGNLVTGIIPFAKKYAEEKNREPDRLMRVLFKKPRKGSMALLRDLQDLWLMAQEASVCGIILRQAALGLRDKDLATVCSHIEHTATRQSAWLLTRMKSAAPQTLIVAD